MLAHIISFIPLLAVASAQSTSCKNEYNGYCCNGSIITSDGSQDTSKLICCQGDPVDNSINLGDAATCTAGTAVLLTQVSSQEPATQSGDIIVDASTQSNSISAGDGSTVIVVGGSTVVGGASTTPQTVMASSVTGMTRSTGSGATMASTASAAATSTGAASAAFASRGQLEGTLTLMAAWLMAVL